MCRKKYFRLVGYMTLKHFFLFIDGDIIHFSKMTRATFSFNPEDVSSESDSDSEEENMLTGDFEVYFEVVLILPSSFIVVDSTILAYQVNFTMLCTGWQNHMPYPKKLKN
jgi:hypothetical protein